MAKDPIAFAITLEAIRNNLADSYPTFSGWELNDDDAIALAEVLPYGTSITKLYLGENNIGDKGIKALAKALHHHPSLKQIYLPRNHISDEGAIAIAEMLTSNNTLVSIDLSRNEIANEGAAAIATALKNSTTLQELQLRNNNIGDAGAIAIADALTHNTSLRFLSLGTNLFENEGAFALARMLKDNRSLVRFLLGYELSQEANDAFDENIIGYNKTLVTFLGAEGRAESYCNNNDEIARQRARQMAEVTTLTPADWLDIAERLAGIEYRGATEGLDIVGIFKTFIATLPHVDVNASSAREAFMKPQGQYTALDNPDTWINFPEIITQLNANGLYVRADALLNEDGSHSPLLERAFETGNVKALFSKPNWRGASPGELNRIIRTLSPEQKEQMGNLHSLMGALHKSAPSSGFSIQ